MRKYILLFRRGIKYNERASVNWDQRRAKLIDHWCDHRATPLQRMRLKQLVFVLEERIDESLTCF